MHIPSETAVARLRFVDIAAFQPAGTARATTQALVGAVQPAPRGHRLRCHQYQNHGIALLDARGDWQSSLRGVGFGIIGIDG
jgi:hypothetical protein